MSRRHPVGAYESTRLSNVGIGHGAIDAAGLHLFNPQTATNSLACSLHLQFQDTATQYQSGVDLHFDWVHRSSVEAGHVGLVGYVYKELGCDSVQATVFGCFLPGG